MELKPRLGSQLELVASGPAEPAGPAGPAGPGPSGHFASSVAVEVAEAVVVAASGHATPVLQLFVDSPGVAGPGDHGWCSPGGHDWAGAEGAAHQVPAVEVGPGKPGRKSPRNLGMRTEKLGGVKASTTNIGFLYV